MEGLSSLKVFQKSITLMVADQPARNTTTVANKKGHTTITC